MKKNKQSSYIIFFGIIILAIFITTIYINLKHNNESDYYYGKTTVESDATIESIEIQNNTIYIVASGNVKEYCLKTTINTPTLNNLCWKEMENNSVTVNVYKNKRYYIWIKDTNDRIIGYKSINS